MATAIEFNNISKIYRLGMVGTGTLRHDLKRWWTMNIQGKEDPYLTIGETNDRSTKGESDYVWALRDIDFKVEQGDVVGIIGKNGAGKSTLLKILSRVTAPTTGTIRARGRIGSLLEVGTGFHPELTGRENIYMNGAILGMSKQEITKKLDEIIDFSGCERYIDTPVKRYSSGMMVRLGFAVAAHLDPEILVVDEVLAVGDAEFQKKAIGKMQDVSRGEGRTVLFVSHNMSAVRKLCHTGLVLENGCIVYSDTVDKCVGYYLNNQISNNIPLCDRLDREGNGAIRIINVNINNLSDDYILKDNIPIVLSIDMIVTRIVFKPRIGISINTIQDDCILWMDSQTTDNTPGIIQSNTRLNIQLSKDFALPAGKYFINIIIYEDNVITDYIQHALEFSVVESTFFNTGYYPGSKGTCLISQKWSFEEYDIKK